MAPLVILNVWCSLKDQTTLFATSARVTIGKLLRSDHTSLQFSVMQYTADENPSVAWEFNMPHPGPEHNHCISLALVGLKRKRLAKSDTYFHSASTLKHLKYTVAKD